MHVMPLHPAVQAALRSEGAAFVQGCGIESTSDLACYFTSEEEIFDAVAEPSVLHCITQAWKIARIRSEVDLQSQPAKCRRVDKPQGLPVCAGAGLRPKARSKPPASLLPKPFRADYAAKPLRVKPAIQDTRVALLKVVLEVVVASASDNRVFGKDVWGNPQETFDMFAARFRNFPEERLRAHISTLRRWIKWHAAHVPAEVMYWKPTPIWLARFLEHVSRGGPTASPQVYASCKWWFSVVGLPLPISDGLVEAWASPVNEHVVQPRTPLALALFWAMLKALKTANGSIASFLTWTVVLLISCLRFAHGMRSHSLRLQDGFLRAICARGKRRVQGRYPPFEWALPAQVTQTIDLSRQLLLDWAELERELQAPPNFIVQDLAVPPGQQLCATTPRIAKPMPLLKFNALLRAVGLGLGAKPEEAEKLSSYSLRRILPTAAEVMQFAPHECQALGNWAEIPATASSAPVKAKAAVGMAQRYADDQVASAAHIKAQVVTSLHQAMLKSAQPALCTWQDIRLHVPPRAVVYEHVNQLIDSGRTVCNDSSSALDRQDSPVPVDNSSSSSDSDASLDECMLTANELPWFVQSATGQKHLVQENQGSRLIPWCRDGTFDSVHFARGAGIEDVNGLCRKCWARMPLAWRDACAQL